MNALRILFLVVCLAWWNIHAAKAEELEKELSKLADKLAILIKENAKKKVTVLDFTDLQGGGNELGKYIAEDLTVNLVMAKRDFAVLDRANLRKILTEHKLTASGLVDPENAKKLGMFSGVDALILGTVIAKGTNTFTLTAKIITTDTAEIVGASKAEFTANQQLQKFVSQSATLGEPSDKAEVVKSFPEISVELNSLTVGNEREYVLDLVVKNSNSKKSVWVAIATQPNGWGAGKGVIRNTARAEFVTSTHLVSGIEVSSLSYEGMFTKATEIEPGSSIPSTIKFMGNGSGPALKGPCTVQIEFLIGSGMNPGYETKATPRNLVVKMEAK